MSMSTRAHTAVSTFTSGWPETRGPLHSLKSPSALGGPRLVPGALSRAHSPLARPVFLQMAAQITEMSFREKGQEYRPLKVEARPHHFSLGDL